MSRGLRWLVIHAKRDLVHARTDVGGAYRSEDAGRRWVPITDSIGREDSDSTGIESLAVDPEDAGRVYLAAAPSDMFPCHVSFGSPGQTYFSDIDNRGPNGVPNGAISAFRPP